MYGSFEYGSIPYGDIGQVSTNYTETFSETITISDDPINALFITALLALTDTVNIIDQIIKGLGRSFIDTSTLSDTLKKDIQYIFIDSLEVTDNFKNNTSRLFTDIISMTDTSSSVRAIIITESDLGLSDTFSKNVELHSLFSDTSTISDVLVNLKGKYFIDIFSIYDWIKKYHNGLSTTWNKIERAVSSLWKKQYKP